MIRLVQGRFIMILHPIALIDGIVSAIIVVQDKKVKEKQSIFQAIWMHGHRISVSNLYQLPSAHKCAGNAICNEEQAVLALQEEGVQFSDCGRPVGGELYRSRRHQRH